MSVDTYLFAYAYISKSTYLVLYGYLCAYK